jgi:hypothetical protein
MRASTSKPREIYSQSSNFVCKFLLAKIEASTKTLFDVVLQQYFNDPDDKFDLLLKCRARLDEDVIFCSIKDGIFFLAQKMFFSLESINVF